LYNELRTNRFAWPDVSPAGYRNLPGVLHAYTGAGPDPLPIKMAEAVDPNNRYLRTDHMQQKVYADVCVNGQMLPNTQVAVLLVPNGQPERRLVEVCKLNRMQNPPITDRRVVNRTEAWFTILRACKNTTSGFGASGQVV
jgi:hypothetical protein